MFSFICSVAWCHTLAVCFDPQFFVYTLVQLCVHANRLTLSGPHLSIVRKAENCAHGHVHSRLGIYQSGQEHTISSDLTSGLTPVQGVDHPFTRFLHAWFTGFKPWLALLFQAARWAGRWFQQILGSTYQKPSADWWWMTPVFLQNENIEDIFIKVQSVGLDLMKFPY